MQENHTYLELLEDPMWQIKRLEIIERDNGLCQCCENDCYELHVHHKRYLPGKKPWEYPNHLLITLCEFCHKLEHDHKENGYDFVDNMENRKNEISDLVQVGSLLPDILKDLKKMVI